MKPLKIVEEGVINRDGRRILTGAIRWVEDTLPVYEGFDLFGSPLGSVTNLRREDGWVVGDLSFDLVDPSFWTISWCINQVVTEADSGNGYFVVLDAILRYVVLFPNLGIPKGLNNE